MVYRPSDAYMLVHSDVSDTKNDTYLHDRIRSDKNVKFINAFMINSFSRLDRLILQTDDGIPFVALADQSAVTGPDLVDYFRNCSNAILLIKRRPFSVERITTGGYRKLYEEFLKTAGE